MSDYEKERTEFVGKFDAAALDSYAVTLEKAVYAAQLIFQLAAYLRSKTRADLVPEMKEFLITGNAGPIITSAITIADGSFLNIRKFNGQNIKKINGKDISEDVLDGLQLLFLLNRFHFPRSGQIPKGYQKFKIRADPMIHFSVMDKTEHQKKYLEPSSNTRWFGTQGVITKLEVTPNDFDDEETNYDIYYEFDYDGEKYKMYKLIKINTNHVEYAMRGQLLNTPKIEFLPKDIERLLSPGNQLDIKFDMSNPLIAVTYFDEIIVAATEL